MRTAIDFKRMRPGVLTQDSRALAVREALGKCRELGIQRLICKTDSSQLVAALNSGNAPPVLPRTCRVLPDFPPVKPDEQAAETNPSSSSALSLEDAASGSSKAAFVPRSRKSLVSSRLCERCLVAAAVGRCEPRSLRCGLLPSLHQTALKSKLGDVFRLLSDVSQLTGAPFINPDHISSLPPQSQVSASSLSSLLQTHHRGASRSPRLSPPSLSTGSSQAFLVVAIEFVFWVKLVLLRSRRDPDPSKRKL
ncbi:hypothetical protein Bca52824_011782 [Brassica carinata]|uniref:RNase H type-1 domain-containing protein n=1 Tax=Brassica carinata TaxID=52824 RepID=A0A8X7VVA7_BRACI|nr:hypothetical protein Bca52824_011782 [Brassica carinata]